MRTNQISIMKKVVSILVCVSIIAGCAGPAVTSGDGGLRYQSSGEVDVMTNFSSGVNTSVLYIDNFEPYFQMLGNSAYNNGPEDISEINITNVSVFFVQIRSSWDFQELTDHLSEVSLIMAWTDGSSAPMSLASYAGPGPDNTLTFTLTPGDLSSAVMSLPDRLFFDFEFTQQPADKIEVTYEVFFDYDWEVIGV